MNTYYLNNSGSRWIFEPKEKITVVFEDGHEEKRTVLEYESFGNFASYQIKVNGKKKRLLPRSDGKLYLDG